jgi:hypothetical protein
MGANGCECVRINTWYGSTNTKGGTRRQKTEGKKLNRGFSRRDADTRDILIKEATAGPSTLRLRRSGRDDREIVAALADQEHPMREHSVEIKGL